ncbi:Glycerol-3-phosphate dehydrogenase [Corynebacterium camporealensis]|uniref:Glycerol-3-phosphate dehydrogenase n=1 Tax=Corynebacterium camporealensis TaxID=161896 RepID=A0A0F6TC07_9CORY|nr:FAD-dependent oxidoreductase [Corynebacterium camporealensis]AKE39959.1 FAD dependent oxidoreductase [Corynebacterium camporealensis]AVH89054.1 Glycerol-3-phosphate dehydrogenase [Corynebacterium camporealensis]
MSTPSGSTSLNAQQRARALQEVGASADDNKVDLVVIGGGITGTGIALDAATRGMSVVLLERNDLGHGTSRWSSKLAHGGLRYLTKLQFGIAHNSAVERGIIMEHTAPHLVYALPQVTFLADNTSLVQKLRCVWVSSPATSCASRLVPLARPCRARALSTPRRQWRCARPASSRDLRARG